MSTQNKGTRVILAAAMLWAGFHACWMPQANCEQPKPPCHQDKDSAPAPHSCCGGLHLSAAVAPHAAFALGSDGMESLVLAPLPSSTEISAPGAEIRVTDAGPPGYCPPVLASSPSRSPPAA